MTSKAECLRRLGKKLTGVEPEGENICKILDQMASSCDDGNFTTTESDTGKKWIDGKPIYRQVVVATNSTLGEELSQLGVDRIVSFYGEMLSKWGNNFVIPSAHATESGYTIEMLHGESDHSQISFIYGSNFLDDSPAYAVIEYTKKDDA